MVRIDQVALHKIASSSDVKVESQFRIGMRVAVRRMTSSSVLEYPGTSFSGSAYREHISRLRVQQLRLALQILRHNERLLICWFSGGSMQH